MSMTFEVKRTVTIMEASEDDACCLAPTGWYWGYKNGGGYHGPYRTMDEAISAAGRGEGYEAPAQASGLHSSPAVAS